MWYEGYPEPEFVWQSTSASDNFEAKFSLVPIAFGTIKAAMFAMLFSVPLAVLGAIYTAYFMSPRMRRVVKPSIELMEALPTVIIGFPCRVMVCTDSRRPSDYGRGDVVCVAIEHHGHGGLVGSDTSISA